ncbi:hypothetical protein GCM10010392_27970 [Streptomyces clavifer]|nr:hypothetical protein GCM10010392_27970 [Streptomyces clavifer]
MGAILGRSSGVAQVCFGPGAARESPWHERSGDLASGEEKDVRSVDLFIFIVFIVLVCAGVGALVSGSAGRRKPLAGRSRRGGRRSSDSGGSGGSDGGSWWAGDSGSGHSGGHSCGGGSSCGGGGGCGGGGN